MHSFPAFLWSAAVLSVVIVGAACDDGSAGGSPVDSGIGDSGQGPSTGDAASPSGDGATSTGDATSPSEGGSSADQEKEICDALASRSACPGGSAPPCTDDVKCIYGKVMLPAAASAYANCRAAPSCKSDDDCVDQAGKSVGGADADQYASDCVARHTTCASQFSGEFCTRALFAYPGASDMKACLTQPCELVEGCFEALQSVKDIKACKGG